MRKTVAVMRGAVRRLVDLARARRYDGVFIYREVNIGGGARISMLAIVRQELGELKVLQCGGQLGDARDTAADITRAAAALGYGIAPSGTCRAAFESRHHGIGPGDSLRG